MKSIAYIAMIGVLTISGCKTSKVPEIETPEIITLNEQGTGAALQIDFQRGKAHNHPLMAVWIVNLDGDYIQTLYVAKSIAKGIFEHGDASTGKWLAGEVRRPAALPVWSHSRGVQEEDGLYIPTTKTAIPDSYSGATPQKSFILNTRIDKPGPEKFYVYFEINQTWDWNEYWTNNKFPDDDAYKTSCQPSLIYRALIDLEKETTEYNMELIGRGHQSGLDGTIYTDLETMTTALNISREITVRIIR